MAHALRVGERALAVAGRVLVQGAHGDAARDDVLAEFDGLVERVLAAPAPGLDGQDLRPAFGGGQFDGRVDPAEPFEHRDGMGVGLALRADGHERLEGVGQFVGEVPALLYLALQRVQPLGEGGHGGDGEQPVRVVGVGVQQGELHQTRRGVHFGASDASEAQSVGIQAFSVGAQVFQPMEMCPFCMVIRQISTPQGPEHAGT